MSTAGHAASSEPIRLLRPLNQLAKRAADHAYYARHPELVRDGRRTPLDRHNPAAVREWCQHYLAQGGLALVDKRGGNPGDHQGYVVKPLPRGRYTLEKAPAKTIRAPRAHVFFASTAALEVEQGWPLRGYYVHIDMDPAARVHFGDAPPYWTDEHGVLHETDPGTGRPVRRLPKFAFAWSDDEAREAVSIAMVYDRDRGELAKRRARVEALAGQGPLPEKYLFRPVMVRTPSGDGVVLQARVPRDPDALDVAACHALIDECEALRARVEAASKHVHDTVLGDAMAQACRLRRAEIDAWLHARPRLRGHLRRYTAGSPHPGATYWQVACEQSDRAFAHAFAEYERALEPLARLLCDRARLELLGRVDRVDEAYNAEGDHDLWRHEFLLFALGAFAGTRYEADVFARFVDPLLESVSTLWGGFRDGCECATCAPMHEGGGGGHAGERATLDLSWWKAKDLKLGTRTAQRLVDLVTKYREQIGKAIHKSRDMARAAQTYGIAFVVRTGAFKARSARVVLRQWYDAWERYFAWATRVGDARNKEWEAIKKEFEELEQIPRGKGLLRDGRDLFKSISTAAALIGAVITMYDVLRQKHLSAKNYADTLKSVTEVVQGVVAVNDIAHNGGYEKFLADRYLANAYGLKDASLLTGIQEAELGSEVLAMAKATQERLTMIAKWAGVVGGVCQLFTAAVAIDESAARGDGREYAWAWVQAAGAGLSMYGLWMDCSVAGEPVGVILNIAGGVIYLVGSAGEWLTRPSAIETLFRNHGMWLETPQYAPGELEAIERREAEEMAEITQQMHPFDGG